MPKTPPKPDKRALKADLTETNTALKCQLEYHKNLIEKFPKLLEIANAKVAAVTAERDQLVTKFNNAPGRIAEIEQAMKRVKNEVVKITIGPKLDKLAKLRARIAELEAETQ